MLIPSARRAIAFSRLVFPVPLPPVMATLAPSGISNFAWSSSMQLPKLKLKSSAEMGNLLCSSRALLWRNRTARMLSGASIPSSASRRLLHVLSRLRYILFCLHAFLMPQSTCILVAFFRSLPLGVDLPCFFRCFSMAAFDNDAGASPVRIESPELCALLLSVADSRSSRPRIRKYRRL